MFVVVGGGGGGGNAKAICYTNDSLNSLEGPAARSLGINEERFELLLVHAPVVITVDAPFH